MQFPDILRCGNLFSSLRHKNFRYYWFAQSVSLIGSWMQNIGQAWIILQLTNSPFFLGLVSAFQFLPSMLLSLFAGAVIDRYPKRNLILICQISFTVLALCLTVLIWLDIIAYWHVLFLALFIGIVNTFDMPSRQSFIIEMVGKDDLMNAIALNSSIFNIARVIGPALAGFLMAYIGYAPCFLLNAASFLPIIIVMLQIPPTVQTAESNFKNNIFKDILKGLRYVKSNLKILMPVISLGMISMFVMNYSVIVPSFAKLILLLDEKGFGMLMSFLGIGAFAGALSIASIKTGEPSAMLLSITGIGLSVFTALLGFQNNYILSAACLIIMGWFMVVFSASCNTIIQLNSSDSFRGRVMSIHALVFNGVIPIGSLYTGTLINMIGIKFTLLLSGIIGIMSIAITQMFKYRLEHKNN